MEYKITLSSSLGIYEIPDEEIPEGWEDFTMVISRHKTLHGLFPNVDCSLRFYDNASKFIYNTYFNEGVSFQVHILVTVELPSGEEYLVFDTIIDSETLVIYPFTNGDTKEYNIQCNLKTTNCTQLFLERMDTSFNIFLSREYDILTFDGTDLHTRYLYSPINILFPAIQLNTFADIKLDNGCNVGAFPSTLLGTCNEVIYIPFATCVPSNTNVDFPNATSYAYPLNAFSPGGPGYTQKVVEQCSSPPARYEVIRRDNRANLFSFADSLAKKNSPVSTHAVYGITDCFTCCQQGEPMFIAGCSCAEYKIYLNVDFDYGFFEHRSTMIPSLNWATISAAISLEIRFGGYTQTIMLNPGATWFPVYQPFDTTYLAGSYTNINIPITIPNNPCLVNIGDEFSVYVRFELLAGLNNVVSLPDTYATGTVTWRKLEVVIVEGCPSVRGSTEEWCIPVHEALTTLVEHYTNNCLRVKTQYFGRQNSLHGGDDILYQRSIDCSTGLPRPIPASYVNPAIPDIEPFQTGTKPNNIAVNDGCGAFFVITQGVTLRRLGREVFTNFKDLFSSLDAIWNIGAGYNREDPNVIRVEAKEFFYSPEVIFEIEVDEITSGMHIDINVESIYKQIKCGYKDTKQAEFKHLDSFATTREYSIQNKSNNKTLEIQSAFVSEGNAIEQQRSITDTAEGPYDEQIIGVCVENGYADITSPLPSMWRVETGIANQALSPKSTNKYLNLFGGLLNPQEVYNFRISPYYNIIRWLNYIAMSFAGVEKKNLILSKGFMNYVVGGGEVGVNPCNQDQAPQIHFEDASIDINTIQSPRFGSLTNRIPLYSHEVIEFDYAITLQEFMLIESKPEGTIIVNKVPYYIDRVNFKINGVSKFRLLRHGAYV